jgi:hypothetical protein
MIIITAITFACSNSRMKGIEITSRCPTIPMDFDRSELNGTWIAQYGASRDTLRIQSDGNYQQIYYRYTDGFSFTSDWKKWWLENGIDGTIYLHLENMRRCDISDELCQKTEGGGGDYPYWDFCSKRTVKMVDDIVLIVTGISEGNATAPKGIWLWHMPTDPDSGSYHFVLKEGEP